MKTGFKTSAQASGAQSDLGDLFVPKYLFSQGGLWSWGRNNAGQLGNNTQTNTSSPVQTVSGGINWKLVSAGYYTSLGIKTDGTLWGWGYNFYSQLGDNTDIGKSSPVQTVAGTSLWKQASTSSLHTAAVKTDGTLWVWGNGFSGQLFLNNNNSYSSPVQVTIGGASWKQVACGSEFTAAVKTDGTLWTCGRGVQGQLGDNSTTNKSSPVQTVAGGTNWKEVACGLYHVAALKTNGTLWLWGGGLQGQLGNEALSNISSPVQTVAGGTNWKLVACGVYHTAAIKTDGSLWLWGANTAGQLGDNTVTRKSSPIQTISAGTNWKLVACGRYHTAAIKTDGTLWAWGQNTYGQLGDNTVTFRSSPIQTITGGTNWKNVSCGDYYVTGVRAYD